MKDGFSKMHPLCSLLFFTAAVAFSMVLMNPVCLAISLLCALMNAIYLNGRKSAMFAVKFILPMVILVTVINPILNHEGVTILQYLPWDNPLTLESIAYGFAAAMMLSSVMLWFSSVNSVMTSDKFVYLFGKIMPALSLLLSMSLRFVPRFNTQFRQVRNAQKCIGKDMSDGGIVAKIKNGVRILSVMMTWALESAIETSDSMKSRGYGLKGRTTFSLYRFNRQHGFFLCVLAAEVLSLTALKIFGAAKFRYFPSLKGNVFEVGSIIFYIVYAAMLLTPFMLSMGEAIHWKRLRSRI